MYYMNVFIIFYSLFTFSSCQKEQAAPAVTNDVVAYDSVPAIKPILPIINETSGIADSKINSGYLWAHEDSGNPPLLYLVKHDGNVLKSIYIKGATNRDWEDMAMAGNDIFIANIGDNNKAYTDYTIYQFAEPSSSVDTVKTFTTIKFKYPDGAHDAEAFLVDPQSKHIYIITKSDNPSNIYKLSFPYSTGTNTLSLVGKLTYSGVVSAALSPSGKEMIVKTYLGLNQYMRTANETIEQALQKTGKTLPYTLEPQGEAVTFASDNSGYFTMSEKGFSSKVNLYFYKKK